MTSDLEARELKRFADEKKSNFIIFLKEATKETDLPLHAQQWIEQLKTIDSITFIIVLRSLLKNQSISEYCDLKLRELGLVDKFTREQRDKFERYLQLFKDLGGDED